MAAAREAGMTLEAMAKVLGVTRQRVMQMLREHG
jgi:DNA-binding XRE family transcriptional regulator